jgi:hypothetical protein
MLIQIGQNSATLTPFGSLGGAHSVGADDSRHGNLVSQTGLALDLQFICSSVTARYSAATAASERSHEPYGCCANVPL